jgi:hypothetical protein
MKCNITAHSDQSCVHHRWERQPVPKHRTPPTESSLGEGQQIAAVDLHDGKRLVLRHASRDDATAVQALYGRLSTNDLDLRFFHAHLPTDLATFNWVTVGERGGVALVVELTASDEPALVVAEAGYSLLEDGDGELAITVDPQWRGWLGPWLLDLLIEQAANNGVANLQATLSVRNRSMRALLAHRGYAAVDHPDWHQIQLVISTKGRTPGWPQNSDRPRLLAASSGARWSGEAEAQKAGFEVRTCPGPARAGGGCPELAGEQCPLLEGADAVVFDLAPGPVENSELVDVLKRTTIPIAYTHMPHGGGSDRCERVSGMLDQIAEGLHMPDHDPT